MRISFILSGEGTSDLNLVDHIEKILVEEGFSEVSGDAPDLSSFPVPVGRAVGDKLEVLAKLYPNTDVFFIHRDSDDVGVVQREEEIASAVRSLNLQRPVIPLIPVRQLETWLLTDLDAIKRVAGNTAYRGGFPFHPDFRRLENEKNAKAVLLESLCIASEAQGSRLKKFRKHFSSMRARLAIDLDPQGPIKDLPSYVHFRKSVASFARRKLNP